MVRDPLVPMCDAAPSTRSTRVGTLGFGPGSETGVWHQDAVAQLRGVVVIFAGPSYALPS